MKKHINKLWKGLIIVVILIFTSAQSLYSQNDFTDAEIRRILELAEKLKLSTNTIETLKEKKEAIKLEAYTWELKWHDQKNINNIEKNINKRYLEIIDTKTHEINIVESNWKRKRNNAYIFGTSTGMILMGLVAWLTGLIG